MMLKPTLISRFCVQKQTVQHTVKNATAAFRRRYAVSPAFLSNRAPAFLSNRARVSTRGYSTKISSAFLSSREQFLRRARLISITGVLVSVAFAASMWSDIRTSQLKGWVLRCMDTFEILDSLGERGDLLELLRQDTNSSEVETSWMGIATIASCLQNMFEDNIPVEKIRENPVFATLISENGIDMAAIFDEEETGFVPLNRLIFGVTLMYVLSQDKVKSSSVELDESNAHEISWMMLVNLRGQQSEEDDGFVVPRSDVKSWIEAAACLGIVRGYEFLNRGGLFSAGPCSEKLYKSWLENTNNNNRSNLVTRSQFFDLMSRVEYGMFWNRNQTTYRTIEFYKKRKRKMEHKMSLMKKDDV